MARRKTQAEPVGGIKDAMVRFVLKQYGPGIKATLLKMSGDEIDKYFGPDGTGTDLLIETILKIWEKR